jgi:hypothetical protein
VDSVPLLPGQINITGETASWAVRRPSIMMTAIPPGGRNDEEFCALRDPVGATGGSAMRRSDAGDGRDRSGADQAAGVIAGAIGAVIRGLDELIPVMEPSKPPVIQLLTFADAVRWFVTNQPGDPNIQGGALLRRPHAAGSLIFQVFLDKTDGVCLGPDRRPYGRAFVAASLDDELAAKFRGSDLVVFR